MGFHLTLPEFHDFFFFFQLSFPFSPCYGHSREFLISRTRWYEVKDRQHYSFSLCTVTINVNTIRKSRKNKLLQILNNASIPNLCFRALTIDTLTLSFHSCVGFFFFFILLFIYVSHLVILQSFITPFINLFV